MSMNKPGRPVKLIQGKNVFFAPEGSHPSKVSGMFKDDPTFDEFLEILHEQREEDYRQTICEIDRELAQEAKACLSSIPTPFSYDQKAHPILKEKVSNTPRRLLFTTSITVEEQLKGRLAFINRHHNSPHHFSLGHAYLMETISYLQEWNTLVYDEDIDVVFAHLRKKRIRIGKQDLRIAATVLYYGYTLVTSNRRDFLQVPNLKIVDWTLPESNGEPG